MIYITKQNNQISITLIDKPFVSGLLTDNETIIAK
jgi:hypothetical protein